MSEQVQLVDILQTDDWNKSEQSRDNIETNAFNDKLAEIRNASKKRDKAFLALTIMLLICFSLAVTVIVIYLEEYIEKSSELEKQIQQLNTSGLERQSHLSNQLGTFSSHHGNFPKGEKGSRGERGPVGHNGTAGDRGQQGRKGETGHKGSAGSKGQLGDVGPIGGKGQNGTKGSQGEKGMSCEKGLLGEKGAVGAKGSAGDKGTIGDEGPSGQKGEVGEKGALGANGQNGSKGVDGEMGQTGLVGPTGRKGSIGEKGPTGDKGPKGEIGLAGIKGENGEKGIRGDKGLMGNMGPVGDKGQIGARGQNGEKGSPGESGRTITCGSGWVQFMRSCYYFQFKSKMTWNSAKTDCHRKGGFLVKIDNTVESWFLKSFIVIDKNPGHVWIGAHDSVQESRFIWESDNTVLTYTDWNPGEPNNAGQEDCAHMNSGAKYKWNDIQCSHKNPGHVWIGAHDSVQESRFIWESDNTVLTYTDWNPGEPNNAGQEDCAHMNSGAKYKWNDIQCSRKFSFICEKH
ncbi:Collagen alpha-4(VI) chain,Collagen-like protein 7 [Mytilus edulis]|uniref:Collagen alpha-4(VI) chain,Collagen-like protein 7 n=1 Tax=Mytilus edulis TaxID=6550 RepID=A0A8S3T693_MYTED|nr:Collagen alpha-4(VI) chain,Collagen-like protein 7 [Mytilus edulis]